MEGMVETGTESLRALTAARSRFSAVGFRLPHCKLAALAEREAF